MKSEEPSPDAVAAPTPAEGGGPVPPAPRPSPPAPSPWSRALDVLSLLVVAVLTWVWFCSLAARASDKVRTLSTIENYALAVHDQLIWNYAFTGEWKQFVHFGYDNAWTWSGHHSVWLFGVAWLYKLAPGPLTLCQIQIAFVALGAFGAWALGRARIGGWLGGLIGGLVWLAYPPLQAVALNDYQDLVLGMPWAIAAIACSRFGTRVGFAICALACAFAREEWLVVMAMVSFTGPGSLRTKLKEGLIGLAVLAPYALFLATHRAKSTGHDTPMLSQIQGMLTGEIPITRTRADFDNFYRVFFSPVQYLGLFAPLTLLLSAPALWFHATAPNNGGVDTTWSGHIHHLAPIATLLAAAAIEGMGTLVRWVRFRPRWQGLLVLIAAVAPMWWTVPLLKNVLRWNNLRTEWTLTPRTDPPDAPEWALIAATPPDAAICTDTIGSILVSSRERSYTYNESLNDKEPQRGIAACDYILVRRSDASWVSRAKAARASELIGETRNYLYYHLPWP